MTITNANLEKQIEKLFENSFMKPYLYEGKFWEIETTEGTEIVPLDVESERQNLWQYVNGRIILRGDIKKRNGYYCRLSANGYMDCTEWAGFKTKHDALEYLASLA
jgi:hypothetical protein